MSSMIKIILGTVITSVIPVLIIEMAKKKKWMELNDFFHRNIIYYMTMFCVLLAGNLYGNMFGIKPEEPIFYIKRMCYADGDSISLEELYIPHYLIPKMDGIDLSVFSVYEVYEMYGIHLAEAEQTLDLVRPSLNDAKLLGIDAGTPVMLFKSLTCDTDGRVIEFNRNYVRGDKCNFNVQFSDKR